MTKVRLYHFHNGKEGGVFSVLKNILKFQQIPDLEHHVIYTINQELIQNYSPPQLQNVVSQKVFYYSKNWNFYFICRKLASHLPDENAVIIANDWLELGMVSNLGLNNPVIQILHGDYNYYYDLAIKHNPNIRLMFCVSPVISKKLQQKLNPEKVIDWRFPISNSENVINSMYGTHIAFISSDLMDPNKNYKILPNIDKILLKKNVAIKWFIAGGGLSKKENEEFWGETAKSRVEFRGFLNEKQLQEFLLQCNAMILPSKQEGLPVSVVEAMKKGIVPFVNYWHGALENLVIEGETGFYANSLKAEEFAQKIETFHGNKKLQEKMSKETRRIADELFDPKKSTMEFESLAMGLEPRTGLKFKAYGSRLDHSIAPNILVNFIRKSKKKWLIH